MRTRADRVVLNLAPREPGASAFRWLCAALRAAILDGGLRPGARLPATRELAVRHHLSRGTIVTAYEQMKAEGYVTSRTGSGTFVNTVLPDSLLEVAAVQRAQRSGSPPRRRWSDAGRRVRAFPLLSPRKAGAFRANQPALDLFPITLWAQVAGRRLRRATVDQLRGCDPRGYAPLRAAVADYLSTSRGVGCVAEQIVIVSGVQEALDLVGRLFLDAGDRVCMEDPGYIGASLTFEALGARIAGLPIDHEGMALPGARDRDARLIYVTPAHQFPLGVSMSLPRRLALIDWARGRGIPIVEDDYDSEFRYAGAPVPALQGLDRHGIVLYAGSFSKVLFPSIRLGYLVVPIDLVDRIAAIKSVATRFVPLLDQAVLSDFITEGHFGRHVRRMREVYAERLGVLLDSSRQWLDGLLVLSDVEAGLQTAAWLPGKVEGAAAAAAAAERGVEVTPFSRYSRSRTEREGLVMGFAAVDPREIRRGVRELAAALEACRRSRRARKS